MARCEDFSACGHEPGCCPDFDESGQQLNMVCVCGAKLPINNRYSICESETKSFITIMESTDMASGLVIRFKVREVLTRDREEKYHRLIADAIVNHRDVCSEEYAMLDHLLHDGNDDPEAIKLYDLRRKLWKDLDREIAINRGSIEAEMIEAQIDVVWKKIQELEDCNVKK